jgi:putative Holliday junction resolvase
MSATTEALASTRRLGHGAGRVFCGGTDRVLQRAQMRTLALDVGSKTIGLALSDADGVVASAWEVRTRSGQDADARDIVERVRLRGVERVVVGLPLELDGVEGHRARQVRRFLDVLTPKLAELGVEVECWDERFSSQAAERTLLEADVSRARRRKVIDALAAQHILQGWLDARRASSPEGAGP